MITPENSPPGAEVICIDADPVSFRPSGVLYPNKIYTVKDWIISPMTGLRVRLNDAPLNSSGEYWKFSPRRFRPLDLGKLDKLLTTAKLKEPA